MNLRIYIRFVALVVMSANSRLSSAAETGVGEAFFETSIRPVLVKHCYECHSAEAAAKEKLQAGLSLDTKHGILVGGESGPAIVPGSPAKSLLIRSLKYESYEMPPTGRLPAAVVADFEKWIEMGAPDPRESAVTTPTPRRAAFSITDEDRRHWAFLPVANPKPPPVRHKSWPRDELDHFVLADVERAGLRPADSADKYSLLRRTTFALIGLPPNPEEITAFVSDESPQAFERVVDRLLGSPEFGVHWGRRWLDGVRYADNIDKSGEYRRWVVRSLNTDLPYDDFVRLQIAGDLLEAAPGTPAEKVHFTGASFDGITATGMMSLAVWEQVGRDLAVAEIVDSQVDLIGRQLLGLTLACARCHDHKFDPISAQDYYALAGILFSSHIVTGKLIADDRLGNELVEIPLLNVEQTAINQRLSREIEDRENRIKRMGETIPLALRLAEAEAERADLEKQLTQAMSSAVKSKLTDRIAGLKAESEKLRADQRKKAWDESPPQLKQILSLRREISELKGRTIVGTKVVSISEGGVPGGKRAGIADAPIYLRGEFQREGAVVPRRFPTVLAGDEQVPIGARTSHSGRRELANWIASPDNPLTARVMVNRVWQQLIGRGLVRSLDNFGKLGERPTHPELLDHLASSFVKEGWSVKRLVRRIVLSSTFRQSSFTTPADVGKDPENRLIAHMNRRRLTYEELRDSLLSLSGRLAEETKNSPAIGEERLFRRTMFEPLDRRKVDVTAAIFDGPDSKAIVPSRVETTTATQALFLMNDPMVVETARRLALRLTIDSTKDGSGQLDRLWLSLFARLPDADEVAIAREYLSDHDPSRLIQALLGTNEFAYLD